MVTVDFPSLSIAVLRHAAALAQKENARLTLLSVIEEPVSFRTLDKVSRERCRLHSRVSALEEIASRELPPDMAVQIVVCEGNPVVEITRMAAQRRTDLIVVGCHPRHWLLRPFHGNTAARVMERAPCPVVVLNEVQSRRARSASRTLPDEPEIVAEAAVSGCKVLQMNGQQKATRTAA